MASDVEVNRSRRRAEQARGRPGREAGQALTEYVAVIGVLLLVAGIVFAAATPVGTSIGEQWLCAVDPIIKEDGQGCDDGTPGGGGGGGGGESGDDYSPPTGDCEDDVTFDFVDKPESPWDTAVVQIDCVWYPGPTICFSAHMPDGHLDRAVPD